MLDIYSEVLAHASNAVAGDPIRTMRIEKIKLYIRWARLKNYAMKNGFSKK
jgi:hypothetical protein